jgi:triacylglycerol lipase
MCLRSLAALSAGALACGGRGVARDRRTPVLLVHGMFGDHRAMEPLAGYLRADGFTHVDAPDLAPVDGTLGVRPLTEQLDRAARALVRRTGARRIDVVGYSLGAMLARYWIQRGDGQVHGRRFVSLAGPHRGVVGGMLSNAQIARELRPESELLQDLERDRDPWGPVQVASFFSPLDAVIVPTETAILGRSRIVHAFGAPTHHHMATDEHLLRAVAGVLSSEPMTLPPDLPTPAQLAGGVREAMRRARAQSPP